MDWCVVAKFNKVNHNPALKNQNGGEKVTVGCFPGRKNYAWQSDYFTQNQGLANRNFIVHNYNCQVTGKALVSLKAVVICKNESKKINRSMLGTLLGSGRGTGADSVVF